MIEKLDEYVDATQTYLGLEEGQRTAAEGDRYYRPFAATDLGRATLVRNPSVAGEGDRVAALPRRRWASTRTSGRAVEGQLIWHNVGFAPDR
jgi:hypothetical protein